jgi:hypothetical protein
MNNNIITTNVGNLQLYPNVNTNTSNYITVIYTDDSLLATNLATDISGIIRDISSLKTRLTDIEARLTNLETQP